MHILKTTPDYYLVYKPCGVDFHNSTESQGFLSQLRTELKEPSLLPVHRLDKDTSGILLIARNKHAASGLAKEFAERRVEKYYIALSTRQPKKKQGWIRGGMKRTRRSAWKLTREQDHFAITRFLSRSFKPGLRLFLIRLYTGRTHQARVALSSIGAPILGDRLYETGQKQQSDRMYLHAFALRFEWKTATESLVLPPTEGTLFQELSKSDILEKWIDPWKLFEK